MKRKPIDIISNLINGLNSLKKNSDCSINEIHEKTGFHYNTVKDYVKILTLVQCFAPKIHLDLEKNQLSVSKYSPYIKTLGKLEQLCLMLFANKAFNKEAATNIIDLKISSNYAKKFSKYINISYGNAG